MRHQVERHSSNFLWWNGVYIPATPRDMCRTGTCSVCTDCPASSACPVQFVQAPIRITKISLRCSEIATDPGPV